MSRLRTTVLLAACGLALLASAPAVAQDLETMELFAWADQSEYGGANRANQGYFVTFDAMQWWISPPEKTTIGKKGETRNVVISVDIDEGDPNDPNDDIITPHTRIEENTVDTGWMKTDLTDGWRYEVGCFEEHHGCMIAGFFLHPQGQRYATSDAHVVFSDPPFGPTGQQLLEGYVDEDLTYIGDLPVVYEDMELKNSLEWWNSEIMWMYRTHPTHHGGMYEFGIGVRYSELDDTFGVAAKGGILDDSVWETVAENHVVGPQAFIRWFRRHGRWGCSAEGRFFSGWNSQNIHQRGTLASQLGTEDVPVGEQGVPLVFESTSFEHAEHMVEWSPAAEVRVNFEWQFTSEVYLQFGWNGYWQDAIARASNMIDYEVPDMGIVTANNRQDIYATGWTIGILVNR